MDERVERLRRLAYDYSTAVAAVVGGSGVVAIWQDIAPTILGVVLLLAGAGWYAYNPEYEEPAEKVEANQSADESAIDKLLGLFGGGDADPESPEKEAGLSALDSLFEPDSEASLDLEFEQETEFEAVAEPGQDLEEELDLDREAEMEATLDAEEELDLDLEEF